MIPVTVKVLCDTASTSELFAHHISTYCAASITADVPHVTILHLQVSRTDVIPVYQPEDGMICLTQIRAWQVKTHTWLPTSVAGYNPHVCLPCEVRFLVG